MASSFVVDPHWEDHIKGDLEAYKDSLGKQIVEDAQRIVPIESGDLHDSLDYEIEGNVIHIYSDIEYSEYVELGTSKMAAEPYLRPALFQSREEFTA